MNRQTNVQRRSLCTWAGMAAGFRVFCAVVIDGGQLYGSAWLSVLMAALLFLPVGGALIAWRRTNPSASAEDALELAAGRWGKRIICLFFTVVLTCDAGAVIGLMSSTAKYVAMPEANRILMRAVTAAAAVGIAMMGAQAAAGAAVLWKRLAAALIAVLVLSQAKFFRSEWLLPVLGPGLGEIGRNALPAAGMLAFSAAGWLMLEPEHDKKGGATLKCIGGGGLIAAALSMMLGMMVPGMMEEPPTRGFRIGRLLANDRAGLTLEMPYVVLLYSGMLTMLAFELCAAARTLEAIFPERGGRICTGVVGAAAFLLSVSPWAGRDAVRVVSEWYYPVIAVPVCLSGLIAWLKMKKGRKAGHGT